jgi:hypothetical protein
MKCQMRLTGETGYSVIIELYCSKRGFAIITRSSSLRAGLSGIQEDE